MQPYIDFVNGNIYAQIVVAALGVLIAAKIVAPLVIFFIKLLTSRTKTTFDDEIIEIARPPIFGTLVLFGLGVSIAIISLPEWVTSYSWPVLKTLMALLWTPALIRIARVVFRAASESGRAKFLNPQSLPLFNNIAMIVISAAAVYMLFSIWGINMTAWLAGAGVVGIAVGFAAKDTLANLISGVFILADQPYKIGDYIVLDSGERGKVTHVGIRSTRILTRGDSEIIIPNAVMGNAKVTNETGGPHKKFRVSVDVGVSYSSDVDKVEKVLMEIAADEELVCKNPEPKVRFRLFGDSALSFSLLCWVAEPELRGKTLDKLNRAVYKRFEKEKIEIPFPQRDVHMVK